MRSIALAGLCCFVAAGMGCRSVCPCHCPCPLACDEAHPAAQAPREQIGPMAPPAPQRIVIEVVQKPPVDLPALPQPAVRQAIPPTPAPAGAVQYAAAVPALTASPASSPAILGGVAYQTPFAASRGFFLDAGSIFDWLLAPFQWLRIVTVAQPQLPAVVLQQTPQYVQTAYAQPLPVLPQAFPGYICPPCPPCAMPPVPNVRAAELDDLARRIHELRNASGN
jgi:hypothetical protein